MPGLVFKRSERWPLWARKAFAPVLAKRKAALAAMPPVPPAPKDHKDVKDFELGRSSMGRVLLREAQHEAMDDEEDVPLTTPRDMEMEEGEEGDGEVRQGGDAVDESRNYRELMEFSAADKKDKDADEEVMPIPGNMYRWWGLGIMQHPRSVQNVGLLFILAAQAFSPPACILNNLYRMDWTHWSFGIDDWLQGPSDFSKHLVATIFLIMFTLNGLVVIKQERLASMKISALLDYRDKEYPDYNKDVSWFWLIMGRLMNCIVVVECCVITYFSFVLSDTPMDVLFNAMAVTFLYNLDDIAGEMGFLQDDDWDGEALGKLYYWDVFILMDELELEDTSLTPYDIHKIPQMVGKYTHWSYKLAEPLLYILAIALPLMYIFIDHLHQRPHGVKKDVIDMQAELKNLTQLVHSMAN
eukprot:Skav204368  [mRNA]  locus=scaffold866:113449:114988:+ [translate_table: standard]